MNTIKVVNIKCGGCENSILRALQKAGMSNIKIDIPNQTVAFDGDAAIAEKILSSMGYSKADSPEAKSFLKKAKSYGSCMVGRIKK
ncbi:MAG: heavy-metal-associated domain-containing protein [Candidatus Pacebacteria bacterium]|jgi:copper chaperone CopZ|nr:heavy-metal-associated domain-containing protein [Candidatus Paceibacterota bacterium]